jgi:hypothetical protein
VPSRLNKKLEDLNVKLEGVLMLIVEAEEKDASYVVYVER